ncbi:Uridylate kinase [Chlamydiales bacterium SCGC AG-110-P3]|nr:Uridylate kinase [Chlamydiales bacterium SCGC AG-110-P3]
MALNLPYRRVLLKISGEGLMGDTNYGFENKATTRIAESIRDLCALGVEVGVVVGAGNIFRGTQATELNLARSPADNIGMLGTIMNGIVLQQAISRLGRDARVLTALECPRAAEAYTWQKAREYMSRGKVVIFVGGTGNPFFTTDTAAALRASEIGAEILLKATKVDGVYDKDPMKHSDAIRYDHITFSQVLTEDLRVMDATAIALCRENDIPILVFNLFSHHPLKEVLSQRRGTLVTRRDSTLKAIQH